jgi:CBS domain-containing protein
VCDKKLLPLLQSHSIFQFLKEDEQLTLIQEAEKIIVKKSHFLIQALKPENYLYLLLDGAARNLFINDEGAETTVLFYYPGDLIGLMSAITHHRTQFSIQAIVDSVVLRLPTKLFSDLLVHNHLFAEGVIRLSSQRFHQLYQSLQQERFFYAHGLDPYPYRKKIGEIMSAPVVTTTPNTSFPDMAKSMLCSSISSLIVLNDSEDPIGIVTQNDMVRAIALHEKSAFEFEAKELMSAPLITLTPESYFYEALLHMAKHNIKHIPVVTENGLLEGIVTMRNLTEARGNAILSVVDELESKTQLHELTRIKNKIHLILESMIKEEAKAWETCGLISELNDRLIRKVIVMCEQSMVEEGYGPLPVDYCWLVMGSEGRREQTFSTDQDNALIYVDPEPKDVQSVLDYFLKLANKIVQGLEQCGFPRCPGDVMASNPNWCHSLTVWKKTIDDWYQKRDGEGLRMFTILLDFRSLYGRQELAEIIRQYVFNKCRGDAYLADRLAHDDIKHPVPLGLFGQIQTKQDQAESEVIDLKHGGVIHLVNTLRLMALHEGITTTSTLERLRALHEKGKFSLDEVTQIREAFHILMDFRIRQHLKQIREEKETTNLLSVKFLSKQDYLRLKKALSTAKWLQQIIVRKFLLGGSG